MEKVLRGYNSPESAFVVDDYPYGFRLRCKIRYWIETTKNGDRFCSQTTNPKKAGEVWNKPKKSTYSAVLVMVQAEDTGYISCRGISLGWSKEDEVKAFMDRAGSDYPWSKDQRAKLALAIGISRTQKYLKVTVGPTPNRTPEEQAAYDAEQAKVREALGKACYCETKGAEKELGL